MRDEYLSVEHHINVLNQLKAPTGLFLASARDVSTGYDKAWLRDNFYIALAYEAMGDWETVRTLYRAILNIFLKHRDKINWAAEHKPSESWQYIHARFHPETFQEYWEEWGNKQNDAVGALLFKFADLQKNGHGVIENDEDRWMIQRLIDYLGNLEYWHDPDNGVWEEYEEVHASSVGAALAGISALRDLGEYTVPDRIIDEGRRALNELLPRESKSKFTDLAQLSLIYPYRIVSREQEDEILWNLEYHLVRDKGVIRYKNDAYYNRNEDHYSEEAEWTFGFSWLAIIYAQRGDIERARHYFGKAQETITTRGEIPELYYSHTDTPNENSPLGWSESMYIVANTELQRRGMLSGKY